MLKSKVEIGLRIVDFVEMVETQFENKVKMTRSDKGTKFLMHVYYTSKGVLHQRIYVYTPRHNGRGLSCFCQDYLRIISQMLLCMLYFS